MKFSMARKYLHRPLRRYDVKPNENKRIKVILSLTRHSLSKLYNTGYLTILHSVRNMPKMSKFMLRSLKYKQCARFNNSTERI